MKSKILTGLCCCLFSISAFAIDTSPVGPSQRYIGLTIGATIPTGYASLAPSNTSVNLQQTLLTGINFAGQVGYRPGGSWPLGFELEAQYVHFDPNRDSSSQFGSVSALALMFNLYYNLIVTNNLMPYIGIGVGYLNLNTHGGGNAISNGNFGLQLIAGVAFTVTPYLTLGIDYSVLGTRNNIRFNDIVDMNHTRLQSINLRVNYLL